MDLLVDQLKLEKTKLERDIRMLQEEMKDLASGELHVANRKGKPQYLYKAQGMDKRRYLHKDELPLAKDLVQRKYDQKLLDVYTARLKRVVSVLKLYNTDNLVDLYDHLTPGRRALVTPHVQTDEAFAESWMSVEYRGKSFAVGTAEIYTERSERVRSKSEKIIADKLYLTGIPYRYEYPVYLDGQMLVHPDFTVLNKRTRTEWLWEHFGRMHDVDYVQQAVKKISMYERNGYFVGKNMIVTYETEQNPLSSRTIERLIHEFLL